MQVKQNTRKQQSIITKQKRQLKRLVNQQLTGFSSHKQVDRKHPADLLRRVTILSALPYIS